MSIIKFNSNSATPNEILDLVKDTNPAQVLILYVGSDGHPRLDCDQSVTVKDLAYYNKIFDILTQEAMLE